MYLLSRPSCCFLLEQWPHATDRATIILFCHTDFHSMLCCPPQHNLFLPKSALALKCH